MIDGRIEHTSWTIADEILLLGGSIPHSLEGERSMEVVNLRDNTLLSIDNTYLGFGIV